MTSEIPGKEVLFLLLQIKCNREKNKYVSYLQFLEIRIDSRSRCRYLNS